MSQADFAVNFFVALQFILAGLADPSVGLINHETAAPYGNSA